MKIKRMFYLLAFTMLCTGLTTSCQDDEECDRISDKGNPAPSFNNKEISNSVYGFVTDERDQPMVGATVKVGTQTKTTDNYGYFEINDEKVVKRAGTVTAEKTGYFRGIRTWVAESGKKQFVRIKLLPKTNVGDFESATGGQIAGNNIKLNFPSNSIVDKATGQEYKGKVNVALQWINPVDEHFSEMMPGDLRAINEEGLVEGLISYGMVAAELTGTDGKILQIAKDKTVEMRTPIEKELSANAPNDMPLWHFDEEKGFWIQEGKTVRQGSEYVGQVSHFSFWNCDVPYKFVYFKCRIVDVDGKPMEGYTVSIKSSLYNYAYSYTDSEGYVSGYVPKNSDLTLNVYSAANRECVIYSQNFSTTTNDVDLGTITVSEISVKKAKVKGIALTCNGDPVANGFLNFTYGTSYYRANIKNGEYEFTHYFCGDIATFDVKIYDTDNAMMKSFQLNLKNGEEYIDPIMVCDEIEGNYIIVKGDGETCILTELLNGFFTFDLTTIRSNGRFEEKIISIGWHGGRLKTGEFEIANFRTFFDINKSGNPNNYERRDFSMDDESSGKVIVTQFALTNSFPDKYTLIGNFEIKDAVIMRNYDEPVDALRGDVTGSFYFKDWDPTEDFIPE